MITLANDGDSQTPPNARLPLVTCPSIPRELQELETDDPAKFKPVSQRCDKKGSNLDRSQVRGRDAPVHFYRVSNEEAEVPTGSCARRWAGARGGGWAGELPARGERSRASSLGPRAARPGPGDRGDAQAGRPQPAPR